MQRGGSDEERNVDVLKYGEVSTGVGDDAMCQEQQYKVGFAEFGLMRCKGQTREIS